MGLKRAGFSTEDIGTLKRAYRLLYRSGLKLADALARIEAEIPENTPGTWWSSSVAAGAESAAEQVS